MSKPKQKQPSKTEQKVLRLIPASQGKLKMISEIGLVNLAYFKESIQPFQTLQVVRELVRNGKVYQPRNDFYRKS